MTRVATVVATVMLLFSLEVLGASSGCQEDVTQYMAHVRSLYDTDKFDALEAMAREARKSKTPFPGGYHKIAAFYDGIFYRKTGGSALHDLVWEAQVKKLKLWIQKKPTSITPRVALALTHRAWGWQRRGHTYAESVEPEAWEKFEEQIKLTHKVLEDAGKLTEKCPIWYLAMLGSAQDEGWDKAQAKELLAKAIAFDPRFHQFYKRHALFLLPQWYGEDGEVEAWAEDVRTSVGGQYGSFLYFELASLIGRDHRSRMSWPEIKAGYAALEALYGSNIGKRNLFAKMALERDDKAAAKEAFGEIGVCWDEDVWGSWDNFRKTRDSLF